MSTVRLPKNGKQNSRQESRPSRSTTDKSPHLVPYGANRRFNYPEFPVDYRPQLNPPPPLIQREPISQYPMRRMNSTDGFNELMNNVRLDDRPFERRIKPENNSSYHSNEGAIANASPLINISFLVMKGQVTQAQIKSNPSLAEFRKVIQTHVNQEVDQYRFVIDSKQLDLKDSHRFDTQKRLIQNGVTIFVLQRMNGGSGRQDIQSYMEIATLIDRIKQKLPQELNNSMKTKAICVACQETKKCTKLCCWPICASCFIIYYATTNFNLKCTDCHKPVEPRRFFQSEEFLQLITCLHQSRKMLDYINFQICRCNSLMSNDTLYSKQKCNECGRDMCFFCNKDWDPDTMQNVQYTCHNNCDYETKITYELLPCLEFDPNLMIPSRRTCPKCFYTGAFGGRCKYHDCFSCGYSFCFICLESKEECQKKYNKTRNQEFHKVPCRDIKQQTYSMFPQLPI